MQRLPTGRRLTDALFFLLAVGLLGFAAFLFVYRSGASTSASDLRYPAALQQVRLSPELWASSERTIALFLSTSCAACARSLDFYARLSEEVGQNPHVALVAMSPEPQHRVQEWLAAGNVFVDAVVQLEYDDARRAGFLTTPMLLLVDADGTADTVLVGALDESQEHTLRERLSRINPPAGFTNLPVVENLTRTELATLARNGNVAVLDIRSRGVFARDGLDGAINIPADELGARARAELDQNMPIVIDCASEITQDCQKTAIAMHKIGFAAVRVATRTPRR